MKLGILGSGYIAAKMAEAVKGLEQQNMGVEAYAVGSRTPAKAQEFAANYGFKKAYGSYQELASDPDVDLIYIATPHSHHFECAKLCLEHGKNLLVEKAFCANTKQATQLVSLAHDKGVFLCEAMWTRFLPALKTIREWIGSGKIGEVQSVEADFSLTISHVERLREPALAGGALLDLGIYSLTFADLFLNESGAGIAGMDAHCVKFHTGVDATDWVNITYKNGKKAFLKASMTSPTHNEGSIYGTAGSIWVKNLNDMEELRLVDEAGNVVETVKPPRIVNCYEYEVLAAKSALDQGKRECPEMPLAKTIEMMELMDSLRDRFGVSYPFEISPAATWDRNGNKSILQVFNVGTGKVETLHEFDCVIEAPNWSADGTFLTYNSEGRIYKYALGTGRTEMVPSHYVDNCNNDHVLSPDGEGVYVSHHTKEDGLSRIYKIFFDGRQPQLVTPLAPSYLHGITPDGKTLAYCAERNGEYDIYTMPTAGGNETRLTTANGLNDGPEYSTDGNYIWFNSVRTGRMQAWCMKADGSEQTQITDDPHWNTWFPHISPDGRMAVMVAYAEGDVRPGEHVPNKNVELRLIERIGNTSPTSPGAWTQSRTILKLFGGQGTINVNSWAPDSSRFAFVSYKK